MNYERVIVYDFPRSGVTPLYNGSSFNRQHNERKKAKRVEAHEAALCSQVLQDGQIRLLPTGEDSLISNARQKLVRKKRARKNRTEYTLSGASGRKIRNKCAAFFSAAARAFVTLTFIQDVGDKKALTCLKQMLHGWRKEHGKDFNYIWVAERQHSGRIHFHIMVSTPMNIKKENARWMRIQYNVGLKAKSKSGQVFERSHIEAWIKAERLQEKFNPFDIEYINSQSHLSHYLTKYVTKTANNLDKAKFEFLPWGCSRRVSRSVTEQCIIPELFFDATTERNSITVEKEFVRKKTGEVVEAGTVIFPNVHKNDWSMSVNILNRQYYHSWLWDMRQLNKKILNDGFVLPIVEYDADHYYNDFVRTYNMDEMQILDMISDVTARVDLNGNIIEMGVMEYSDEAYFGRDEITGARITAANNYSLN